MSAFLKALAYVSPTAALKRAHALAALDQHSRYYDGAQRGRRGASFKGTNSDSANMAIGPALAQLRGRSSDLVRNTFIGSRIIDILTAHVIGTGIGVMWNDPRVQELWDEWCLVSDIEGEQSFAGQQRNGFRSLLERGDSGVRMIPRRMSDFRKVPLALKVVEGDYIATERNGVFDQHQSRLGVVIGDWDERLGYWLHDQHPGDYMLGSTGIPKYVERADFCHLYRSLRAGQVRGVPVLAPIIMGTRDYADLMDAIIVKLRMEACHGLVITSADPVRNMADATTRQDQSGRQIESLSPGMIYRAALGETVTSVQPAGSGAFAEAGMSALMGIASGGMVTYDQLTGDLRQANYSSLRAGKIEFRRLVEQIQHLDLVPMLMHRITSRWLELAIMSGKVRQRKRPYAREYLMPAIEPIDPLKDLKADILAVRSGRMSPQEFIGSWGRDWRKIMKEYSEFWKVADADKLILDIDPRRVNQLGSDQGDGSKSSNTSDDDEADDDATNTKPKSEDE